MKNVLVASIVSLAMLSLGLGGCHFSDGGPCCGQGGTNLVAAGETNPCCELSVPPTLAEASAGAKGAYHPALIAASALASADPARARTATARSSFTHPRRLYRLDCTLRL